MRRSILIFLASCVLAAPTQAQGTDRSATAGRTFLWATGGALVGGLAGGIIGTSIASREEVCQIGDPDGCLGAQLPRALWGTGIGITVGTPLGAHLGNRRRGHIVYTALTSAALFAGEIIALDALVDDGRTERKSTVVGIAVVMPALQILATTLVERRFTKASR